MDIAQKLLQYAISFALTQLFGVYKRTLWTDMIYHLPPEADPYNWRLIFLGKKTEKR